MSLWTVLTMLGTPAVLAFLAGALVKARLRAAHQRELADHARRKALENEASNELLERSLDVLAAFSNLRKEAEGGWLEQARPRWRQAVGALKESVDRRGHLVSDESRAALVAMYEQALRVGSSTDDPDNALGIGEFVDFELQLEQAVQGVAEMLRGLMQR